MSASPPIIHLEMSISRSEFLRCLNHLANETESFSQLGESEWELPDGSHCARIIFHELTPRRLGALTLPHARVILDLHRMPPHRREDFLHRFRRVFQRAGG